jgi:hypothetical protein
MVDRRHFVPRFAGHMPTWTAINGTVMEGKVGKCFVMVENWESDSKDTLPLTLWQVRYSQAEAGSYITGPGSIFAKQRMTMMSGPDVYEVRCKDKIIAHLWQPVLWQPVRPKAQLAITYADSEISPVLFGELTVDYVLKLLNEKLNGKWRRPKNATLQLLL